MKKFFKWIFYIFVALIILGYISSKKEDSTSDSAGNTSSASTETRQAPPEKQVFQTTARQLAASYEENEVATDEKMKGQLVAVKGVVQSIDKDFADSIIISFKTDNQFMPARMQMKDSEKSMAISLKKGQQVTVVCERMSRVVGSPSGRSCSFN
ncbi:OB-fold protein [Dryocola sp. BD586]|uniref:OB-fold protein n=1 Tax=Dryocola sp. BD586 TaxID=3133271 RepID=UPI003F50883C